jgi:excinuclease UvrABC nuclease subunit
VRFLGSNPYPRITVTHRPSQREADWIYGPFPSRATAERYAEEMLKLFLLRRCTFDLDPDPSYPGCVYSEMKMCLAPCYKGCTDKRYGEEAAAVESFLATRGESRLVTLRGQREAASANLEFESAAALHAQPPNWFARSVNFVPSFCKPRPTRARLLSFFTKTAVSAVRPNSPRSE